MFMLLLLGATTGYYNCHRKSGAGNIPLPWKDCRRVFSCRSSSSSSSSSVTPQKMIVLRTCPYGGILFILHVIHLSVGWCGKKHPILRGAEKVWPWRTPLERRVEKRIDKTKTSVELQLYDIRISFSRDTMTLVGKFVCETNTYVWHHDFSDPIKTLNMYFPTWNHTIRRTWLTAATSKKKKKRCEKSSSAGKHDG